jgi:hypothetical protein
MPLDQVSEEEKGEHVPLLVDLFIVHIPVGLVASLLLVGETKPLGCNPVVDLHVGFERYGSVHACPKDQLDPDIKFQG